MRTTPPPNLLDAPFPMEARPFFNVSAYVSSHLYERRNPRSSALFSVNPYTEHTPYCTALPPPPPSRYDRRSTSAQDFLYRSHPTRSCLHTLVLTCCPSTTKPGIRFSLGVVKSQPNSFCTVPQTLRPQRPPSHPQFLPLCQTSSMFLWLIPPL